VNPPARLDGAGSDRKRRRVESESARVFPTQALFYVGAQNASDGRNTKLFASCNNNALGLRLR